MLVSGAKFEEHCFNISRDISDGVLYCFNGTTYDVITFLICIIQKRKYLHRAIFLLRKLQAASNGFLFCVNLGLDSVTLRHIDNS